MEVTLAKIFNVQPVIKKLLEQDMPIKTAYKLSKMAKVLNFEYEEIDKQKTVLIQKLGHEKEEGKYEVAKENYDQFIQEFGDFLNNEKTELEFEPISLDSLPDSVKLSPQELLAIEFLFNS